jgi:hypothetical protein
MHEGAVLDQTNLVLIGGPCDGYILVWEEEGCEHLDHPHHHFADAWGRDPMGPLMPVEVRWLGEDFIVVHTHSGVECDYAREVPTACWHHVPD